MNQGSFISQKLSTISNRETDAKARCNCTPSSTRKYIENKTLLEITQKHLKWRNIGGQHKYILLFSNQLFLRSYNSGQDQIAII